MDNEIEVKSIEQEVIDAFDVIDRFRRKVLAELEIEKGYAACSLNVRGDSEREVNFYLSKDSWGGIVGALGSVCVFEEYDACALTTDLAGNVENDMGISRQEAKDRLEFEAWRAAKAASAGGASEQTPSAEEGEGR